MLVKAKCIAPAWDSKNAVMYYPGFEYEIDSDSELAALTTIPVGYDKNGNAVRYSRDQEGKIESIRIPMPPYVFDFDRNGTRTNAGVEVKKDYSCKKCGNKFKTLPALGRHSRSCKVVPASAPEVEDAVVA